MPLTFLFFKPFLRSTHLPNLDRKKPNIRILDACNFNETLDYRPLFLYNPYEKNNTKLSQGNSVRVLC